MKFGTKLSALLLITVSVWLVSETGSEKMTLACSFGLAQPCQNADSARRTLYLIAAGSALGIVMRTSSSVPPQGGRQQ